MRDVSLRIRGFLLLLNGVGELSPGEKTIPSALIQFHVTCL